MKESIALIISFLVNSDAQSDLGANGTMKIQD